VIVPLRPPSRAPSRGAKRTALTGRARKGTISEAPPRVRGARAPWGTGAIGDRGAFQRKGGEYAQLLPFISCRLSARTPQ
jgi:hypothetical protein